MIPAINILACLAVLLAAMAGSSFSQDKEKSVPANMVLVKGGTFRMGDVFGEGRDNEKPVHEVTLSDFYICKYETTVGEFKRFVSETGYKTSAQAPVDSAAYMKIMQKATSGNLTPEEMMKLKEEMLQMGGTGYWDAEKRQWLGYRPDIFWKNPGIAQTNEHPVLGISPDDAMQYCNWLSLQAGLPVAYNLKTGNMLDAEGRPTDDITQVRGIRLPTEAEWEYAAREGGRQVRFGNGKNVAKSSEINFRADDGEYSYLKAGEYRKCTTPVGSFGPNSLDLYDMSGNAWEWTGDNFVTYLDKAQINPCASDGDEYALRGGRWGGDAFEARVFHRSPWVRNDRCNNSGFRVAKSK